jgi:uncharacterized membrane protein
MEYSKKYMKLFASRLLKYFLRGILVTLPLAGTVWLVIQTVSWLDHLLGLKIPGLGIVVILVGVTLIGFFGSGLLLRPILDILDDLLEKVPGVKIIYTSIKDFLEAFVGDKRKFKEPVAVEMGPSVFKMGFVTHKDLSMIGFEGYVSVYFPHSYNFSGNVFIVAAGKVKPIDANASEVMKFIVTGGVSEITDKRSDDAKDDTTTNTSTDNTFRAPIH